MDKITHQVRAERWTRILNVRGKVILQPQGKEFFTSRGNDFFT